MSTKITLTPVHVDKFPATWHGTFSGHPTASEIRKKKAKIEEVMLDDLKEKVKSLKASPGFSLGFKWQKTSADPTEYDLEVTTKRRHHKGDEGSPTDPTPKSPPPPPM